MKYSVLKEYKINVTQILITFCRDFLEILEKFLENF